MEQQNKIIKVGYCTKTKNKVLKQYDPHNTDEEKDWLCLHNNTVEEDLKAVEEFEKMQNKNDMFEDMRAAGSTLPDIVEALKKRGWRNYNHHDNWIHPNVIGEYDTHRAYETIVLNVGLAAAMKQLSKALIEDEDYWQGWQSNIAMCMYDEYTEEYPVMTQISHADILEIANKGAERFLILLTSEKKITQDDI